MSDSPMKVTTSYGDALGELTDTQALEVLVSFGIVLQFNIQATQTTRSSVQDMPELAATQVRIRRCHSVT